MHPSQSANVSKAYLLSRRSQGAIGLFALLSAQALVLAPLAWAEATTTGTETGDASCYVEGLADRLKCGFITVAENPDKPAGRQIDIHYAVLPAIKQSHPGEALLAIAGGPGQSAIDNAANFDRIFTKVRQQRDILLIDQRGTGRSHPLNCDSDPTLEPLALDDTALDIGAEASRCLAKLDADVTQYGSLQALADFELVRRKLGYDKLHLYGISYGTRMAQLYMRRYPEHLASVTLDGVVPMQQSVLAIAGAIDRAFELLLRDCRETRACQAQFPTLADDLTQVEARLAKAPNLSQSRDPLTGEPTPLTMTLGKFLGAIRMALYMPNTRALLPHAIHEAARENYQPILGLYALTLDGAGMAMGMHASVVCGEDMQRLTPALKARTRASRIGRDMLDGLSQTCAVWQIPAASADFAEPIASDLPTLVLSGELDPATPPSWGELALARLTHAKHFIAPHATHGVAFQSCGNNLVAQLVESGSLEDLDADCLSKDVRRSFYLNASTVEAIPSAGKQTAAAGPAKEQP
ncbi:alpha/beta hydrolase [Shewanella sp. AS16]|uniref:alpha/beta hydrolase n=1 Tax=Shewanella sp. AS16 TaxID=2907625 RepID=UPI001F1E5F7E|nr:alpha/beta hydrolase [Shewanella sp. AS16]MCE9688136.1 alpha/beta hydrolase [Shewanella sp. AS16]